ncbi:MAG TPA: rhomboid family intramembrane serine protease [Flavobacteriia bacterium]|nr:rhomboid family intramembrane serine protease [Flavobacteriia bacterium]
MDSITLIIIAITAVISYKGFNDQFFFNKYKFNVGAIKRGERIRFLSAGFLHADMMHLIFNMLTLYFFANYIIINLGRINFLIIYLGSLIAGNLITYYFHKNQPQYSAIGASGAVMGILYAAILINPNITLGLFGIIPVPGFVFAIGYLLYSIYGMKNSVGNIGHTAHLGGAIAGYVLTILLHPQVLQTSRMMVIVLAIPIILMYIFRDKLKL